MYLNRSCGVLSLGPNALRILRDLGVLDDVIAQCKQTDLNLGEFRFLSAEGDHKLLYDVRYVHIYWYVRRCSYAQQYPVAPNGAGNGLAAYR